MGPSVGECDRDKDGHCLATTVDPAVQQRLDAIRDPELLRGVAGVLPAVQSRGGRRRAGRRGAGHYGRGRRGAGRHGRGRAGSAAPGRRGRAVRAPPQLATSTPVKSVARVSRRARGKRVSRFGPSLSCIRSPAGVLGIRSPTRDGFGTVSRATTESKQHHDDPEVSERAAPANPLLRPRTRQLDSRLPEPLTEPPRAPPAITAVSSMQVTRCNRGLPSSSPISRRTASSGLRPRLPLSPELCFGTNSGVTLVPTMRAQKRLPIA